MAMDVIGCLFHDDFLYFKFNFRPLYAVIQIDLTMCITTKVIE